MGACLCEGLGGRGGGVRGEGAAPAGLGGQEGEAGDGGGEPSHFCSRSCCCFSRRLSKKSVDNFFLISSLVANIRFVRTYYGEVFHF